jgi:hypothetical protein
MWTTRRALGPPPVIILSSSDKCLFDLVNRHFDVVLVYLRFDGMAHRCGEGGPEHPESARRGRDDEFTHFAAGDCCIQAVCQSLQKRSLRFIVPIGLFDCTTACTDRWT